MIDAAVAVSGLTKVFPVPFHRQPIVAVRGLDLRVQAGEVYGLLGPNGSGKSTTLKIILGLVSPTRGHTEIFGHDSRLVESREAVGFLPENPYFYKYLTGEETLRFFGRLCGLSGARLKKRIDELLELVGLTNARDRRLGTYSKGMLQRIGLAQALINEPKLVLLDEPTAGVDPAGSREIRNLIVDLKRSGITVLLSSHLLAQVQEICDRVAVLANGVLVREGQLAELIAIENQTEFVVANASSHLVEEIESLIGSSIFMARLTFQQEFQILKDVSLGAISIYTSLLAIVATARLIPKDVEDCTVYTILAKPVPRFEYVLGKLAGVLLLLAISTLVMSAVFLVVLYTREQAMLHQTLSQMSAAPREQVDDALRAVRSSTLNINIFPGVAIIYLKACLLAALTLFVSMFATTNIFTIVVMVFIYFIGHLQAIAREYWLQEHSAGWMARLFLLLVALIFPDLD